MHSQIAAQLCIRGEQLLAGQFDPLLDGYHYPLPVFLPTLRMVLQGPDAARCALALLRHALIDRGVVSLCPLVTAIELPRAGRFRLWVDWQERGLPGTESRTSSAIYYCRATALGPRIEMVNYTHLSMPDLHQQFEALALSA